MIEQHMYTLELSQFLQAEYILCPEIYQRHPVKKKQNCSITQKIKICLQCPQQEDSSGGGMFIINKYARCGGACSAALYLLPTPAYIDYI